MSVDRLSSSSSSAAQQKDATSSPGRAQQPAEIADTAQESESDTIQLRTRVNNLLDDDGYGSKVFENSNPSIYEGLSQVVHIYEELTTKSVEGTLDERYYTELTKRLDGWEATCKHHLKNDNSDQQLLKRLVHKCKQVAEGIGEQLKNRSRAAGRLHTVSSTATTGSDIKNVGRTIGGSSDDFSNYANRNTLRQKIMALKSDRSEYDKIDWQLRGAFDELIPIYDELQQKVNQDHLDMSVLGNLEERLDRCDIKYSGLIRTRHATTPSKTVGGQSLLSALLEECRSLHATLAHAVHDKSDPTWQHRKSSGSAATKARQVDSPSQQPLPVSNAARFNPSDAPSAVDRQASRPL